MEKLITECNLRKKSQAFIFLVIILAVISPCGYSQSLIEKLGGVKTSFQITTESIEMPIIEQIILKRGVRRYKINSVSDYAYGYGLQTFHLEFITKVEILEKYRSKKRANRKLYEIKLFDKKDVLLLNKEIELNELNKLSNGKDLFTYSINLRKIPIVLLNRTKTINIDKIKKGKR